MESEKMNKGERSSIRKGEGERMESNTSPGGKREKRVRRKESKKGLHGRHKEEIQGRQRLECLIVCIKFFSWNFLPAFLLVGEHRNLQNLPTYSTRLGIVTWSVGEEASVPVNYG